MPNFTDKVAKWSLQPNLDTLRQADGRFYLLPGLHQDVWMDYSLAVRTDLLDKHKLAIPTTWDELYTVLKALKAEYPDQYPMTDRWGIPTPGGNLLDIAAFAFGTRGGWGYTPEYWDAAAQKFIATAAMPQYRQMLEFLTKLVKEGLLDPESFTQTDDQAKAKFNSGKSFVISTNAQTLVNDYRPTLTKNIPDAKIVKIPVPIGPAGALKNEITRLENGVMISAKAKDRPDFVAMMQFIDWLWYSDEGQMFAKWGVEGTTYTKDAGGAIKLAKDVDMIGLNPGAPKHLQKDFGFGNGIFAYGGTTTLLESTFSEEEKEFQKAMNARKSFPVPPPAPLSEEEREQVTAWLTPLKDYVAQQSLAFILGKRDLAEWDAYVKELDGKNLTAYVDIVNKAHQRYKSAHG
jgi:putative aldouronate transport system substrate-binding protein